MFVDKKYKKYIFVYFNATGSGFRIAKSLRIRNTSNKSSRASSSSFEKACMIWEAGDILNSRLGDGCYPDYFIFVLWILTQLAGVFTLVWLLNCGTGTLIPYCTLSTSIHFWVPFSLYWRHARNMSVWLWTVLGRILNVFSKEFRHCSDLLYKILFAFQAALQPFHLWNSTVQ